MGKIEDETHFLCVCPKFDIERTVLFNIVTNKCQNFFNLENESKLIFLLSNEDTGILSAVAKFIIDKHD